MGNMSNDQSCFAANPDVLEAARCTAVFCLLYLVTFVNVLVRKFVCLREARQADKKKEYDQYTSLDMRPADRLQANFLEWFPVYFGLLWSLALTENLGSSGASVSRAYLCLRALYIVLVLKSGVSSNGLNPNLYVSTLSAYACLTYLGVRAIRVLFL